VTAVAFPRAFELRGVNKCRRSVGRLGNRILREAGIERQFTIRIVLETEASSAVSAYVPGLPVYAAAETHTKAERAIRTVLMAYLKAHRSRPDTRVRLARFSLSGKPTVDIVGVAALVGARRRATKARRFTNERQTRRSTSHSRNQTNAFEEIALNVAG
jgi:hypothetical protein